MVTTNLPLPIVARLGKTAYHPLYLQTRPRKSVYVRKDGTVSSKTLAPKIASYRGEDGKLWLTAAEINRLIEDKVIRDFTISG